MRGRGKDRYATGTHRVEDNAFSMPYSGSVIGGLLLFFDSVIVCLTGVAVYVLYVGWDQASFPRYLVASGLVAIAITGGLHSVGVYRSDFLTNSFLQQAQKIVPLCIIGYVVLLVILFGLKISDSFSRVWFFLWFASATSIVCLQRVCLQKLLRKWGQTGRISRNVAIIGTGEQAKRLSVHLEQRRDPWNKVIGIFDDRTNPGRANHTSACLPVLGSIDGLLDFARKYRIDDIIVALPLNASERLLSVVTKLKELPVNIHLAWDLADLICGRPRFSYIEGLPLIDVAHKPLSGWNVLVKEIEDKAIAGILLLMLSPVFLLISLAIKLDSEGPVFFRQLRHGFNNRVFAVFKFRTMFHNGSEEIIPQARRNDPRVTRVGRLLRRTSLDELPQLLNVLQGSMSVVGPRPHPLPLNEQFAAHVDGFFSRHRIKPGMTGWAQVNGLRGETNSPERMTARVEYDLYYIENWSLLFDLRILIMTLFVGFVHKNAY